MALARTFLSEKANANEIVVSEVIAVSIRNPGSKRGPFLGPQFFAGFSYIIATFIMLELWRVHRKNKLEEQHQATSRDSERADG